MVIDRGGRLAFFAAVAGLIVWSIWVHTFCAAIAFTVLAIVSAGLFRMFRSEPRGNMEGSMTEGLALVERERITKRMAAVAVGLFLVTAVGLTAATDVYLRMSSHDIHDYRVTVEAATDEPFVVMCPIPCTLKGILYENLLDNLVILNGSAELEVLDTEHGPALRIEGAGDVQLEWTAVWPTDEGRFPNITMTRELDNETEVEAWDYNANAESWVFSDTAGVYVQLRYSSAYDRQLTITFGDIGADTFMFTSVLDAPGWSTVGTEHSGYMS